MKARSCPRRRQGRQHLHPESLAGYVPDHLGRPGSFCHTYFARYCKDPKSKDWRDWPYLTGDAAVEGRRRLLPDPGRIDDVINVSGHRLGTKEIESAALVVLRRWPKPPLCRLTTKSRARSRISISPSNRGIEASDELAKKISDAICRNRQDRQAAQGLDRPGHAQDPFRQDHAPGAGRPVQQGDVGDVMTLANPEIVEEIKKMVQEITFKK
jgi:acetyl-CoA synthetase